MHLLHLTVEFLDNLRIFRGEVGGLLGVIFQIVEFQWSIALDGDAFPVAASCRTLLAGKFPIKQAVVGVNLSSEEQRRDVDAVYVARQC